MERDDEMHAGGRAGIVVLPLVLLTALFGIAGTAAAAERFAEPNGDGPAGTCPESNPCSLQNAIEDASVGAGDVVTVLPGTYETQTDELTIGADITVRGRETSPMPVIPSTVGGPAVFLTASGVELRWLRIQSSTVGVSVPPPTNNYLFERVFIQSSSGVAEACRVNSPGTIRDSVCWGSGGGRGIVASSSSGTYTLTARNVTAISTGNPALEAETHNTGNVTIDAKNTIADGGGLGDVRASASDAASVSTVTLANSNYASENESAPGGGSATVTNPGTGTNQTAAPLFVNAAGGDFHQQAASPTRNTGAGTPGADGVGALDFDSQSRGQEAAIDIGADEFVPVPTERFTEPNGNGPSGPNQCVVSDPCSIQAAVEGTGPNDVIDGDVVTVLPGVYEAQGANELTVVDDITLRGLETSPMPVIPTNVTVIHDGVEVRWLHLQATGGSALGLFGSGALAERVVAEQSAGGGACAIGRDATLRDSVCWSTGTAAGVFVDSDISFNATVRNVTAVSSVGAGMQVAALDGAQVTLDVRNTIARGNGLDVGATAVNGGVPTVNLANSNYGTEGGNGNVTDPGTGTNQTTAPQFVNTPAGNFHQQAGSPTVDAGDAGAASLGALDIDAGARTVAALGCPPKPDIGADELVPATALDCSPPPPEEGDTTPPDTTITDGPQGKTKKKSATVSFSGSDSRAVARFECRLDDGQFEACTSPKTYSSLRKGKHTVAVRAVDDAGNADPTPATSSWTVKKKKKKK